jgi:hypothetical protein
LQFISSQTDPDPLHSDRLVIKYQLISGAGGVISTDFLLHATNNYQNHAEVMVQIQTAGANPVIKGSCVAHLNIGGYASPYKPMCWIKNAVSGNYNEIFFKVDALPEQIPTNPSVIQAVPTQNKVILYYDMNGGSSGNFERNYNLASYSTYSKVEVQIRDTMLRTKGKGTTDQADADAS